VGHQRQVGVVAACLLVEQPQQAGEELPGALPAAARAGAGQRQRQQRPGPPQPGLAALEPVARLAQELADAFEVSADRGRLVALDVDQPGLRPVGRPALQRRARRSPSRQPAGGSGQSRGPCAGSSHFSCGRPPAPAGISQASQASRRRSPWEMKTWPGMRTLAAARGERGA
jgi:hypothetical protein